MSVRDGKIKREERVKEKWGAERGENLESKNQVLLYVYLHT